MVLIRDYAVRPYAFLSGGSSVLDAVSVSQKPATVYSVAAFNRSSASVAYLHIFDSSAARSSGTAVQTYTVPFNVFVEGSTRTSVGAGFIFTPHYGFNVDNGIAFAVSANHLSSAYSSVASAQVIVNLTFESAS